MNEFEKQTEETSDFIEEVNSEVKGEGDPFPYEEIITITKVE